MRMRRLGRHANQYNYDEPLKERVQPYINFCGGLSEITKKLIEQINVPRP